MKDAKIALQLYTLRDLTGRDMLGTLKQIASQGYRAVEFAGFGGVPVADIRALLDEHGMRAVAAHIGLDDLRSRPEEVLADLNSLGCSYAVVAYVAQERRRNARQVREIGETFNRYGDICREAGLRFAYHNHAFEFEPLDGSMMFEILLDTTDASLVAFELDVYWLHHAGVDPVQMIKRLAGRIPLVHIKDMEAGEGRRDAPVGDGILPWQEILPACAAGGTEWYIIEQDNPRNPLNDVERSLNNLREMLGKI
ncbi:MAG TPA: sugar phosphate isomerase/epimerase [Chloroflexia bacterium]